MGSSPLGVGPLGVGPLGVSHLTPLTPPLTTPTPPARGSGSKADAMYFLLSGRATVVNDKGVRVKSFVEGSFFGEVGCMLGGVRSADVVAASTCQLQVGTRDQFHASNDFHDFTITKFFLTQAISK